MSRTNFEKTLTDVKKDGSLARGLIACRNHKAGSAASLAAAMSSSVISNSSRNASMSSKDLGKPGRTPGRRLPLTPVGKNAGARGLSQAAAGSGAVGKGLHQSKRRGPVVVEGDADRYIPNRSTTDMEAGHYMLMRSLSATKGDETEEETEYQRLVAESLNLPQTGDRILSFKQKAVEYKQGEKKTIGVGATARTAPIKRNIPQMPERVLDAPDLIDDYYLNTLSWSYHNILAIALGSAVYLWDASTGSISTLAECGQPEEYVCSVSWASDGGDVLAVGSSSGRVQLWDAGAGKMLRNMWMDGTARGQRVPVLAWNRHLLSCGSRLGVIEHHDVRVGNHLVGRAEKHNQEVCGLAWSPDGRYLASGGNDNLVCVWQGNDVSSLTGTEPLHVFDDHNAAVKGVAWCPWKPTLFATGGGTNDRHMRFWNAASGAAVKAVDTGSQVSGIVWNSEYRELLTGHGFSENQLTIWKYPQMQKVTELKGHQARVLCLAASPNGEMVASAAADETLRIWKCFEADPVKRKQEAKKASMQPSILRAGLR